MYKKRLKVFSIATSLIFISTFFSVPVEAVEVEALKEYEITQSRFNYIDVYTNKFEISENGKASFSTTLWARNIDKVRLTGYLQQYSNGKWITIKSWSNTTNGTEAILAKSWFVSSGYLYRYKSYAYLYNNGEFVETTNYISASKYY